VKLGYRRSIDRRHGAGGITVDFQVEFNDSGQILTATVPFQRHGAG
jgi:hypothetical protein